MEKMKRRDFIKKSAIGSAGVAIGAMGFSPKSYASILGANDRLTVSVVGLRSRGGKHISAFCTLKDSRNVRIKSICDVDEQFFAERVKTIQNRTGVKASTEVDMRKVLDDKDIDVVAFATPNFWHALGTIWACQAGKHVYIEKPVSWCIDEGRKMIQAAKKYDVRVQVGTQGRTNANTIKAMKFLQDGGIGDIYKARALVIKSRSPFGIAQNSEPPASLHYDMWLGPVSYRPYNEKKVHYNWHWFWDTGNGETGNTGPHMLDIARWGMNKKEEHPVMAYSIGNRFAFSGCEQETPNTQSSMFKYKDNSMIELDVRGLYSNAEADMGLRQGNIFYGTDGYLVLGLFSAWKAYRKNEKKPFVVSTPEGVQEEITLKGTEGAEHFANFLDAIRSGKDEDLNANISDGHYAAALSHMGNISHRLGRGMQFDDAQEKFINDPEANAMLTRKKYRKPYVVPDNV